MPRSVPVRIASFTPITSPFLMSSEMYGVFIITSHAATRVPIFANTSRCERMARRYCDRSRNI